MTGTLHQGLVAGQALPLDLLSRISGRDSHHMSMYIRAGLSRELSLVEMFRRWRGHRRRLALVQLQELSGEALGLTEILQMKARRMAWIVIQMPWAHHPRLTKTCRRFVTNMVG